MKNGTRREPVRLMEESVIEGSLDLILDNDENVSLPASSEQDSDFFPRKLEQWKKPLDNILNIIFYFSPTLKQRLSASDANHGELRRDVYQGIRRYGRKKRKIGDRYYAHHIFLGTLRTQKKKKRKILEKFSQLGEELEHKLPESPNDLTYYKEGLEKLFGDYIHTHPRHELIYTYKNLTRYFQSLPAFVSELKIANDCREEDLREKELISFAQERKVGTHQLGLEDKFPTLDHEMQACLTTLSRLASDSYYQAIARIFVDERGAELPFDPVFVAKAFAKGTDDVANTMDGNRWGRQPGIKYFTFNPKVPKLELAKLLEEDQQTFEKKVDELLSDKEHLHEHLNLASLLEIKAEYWSHPAVQRLDKAVYEINQENNAIHERLNRERESYSLLPHNRLYRLYKNLIYVNNLRRYFDPKNHPERKIPEILKNVVNFILEKSREETNSLAESAFSNHCLSYGSTLFNPADAREIYQTAQIYDQELDAFREVTQAIPKKLKTGKLPPEERRRIEAARLHDGLIERIFHQLVLGTKSVTKPLFRNKKEVFLISYDLDCLLEKYQEDQNFYLHNLTYQGPQPASPAGLRKAS